jgi:hypothetical protein
VVAFVAGAVTFGVAVFLLRAWPDELMRRRQIRPVRAPVTEPHAEAVFED